VSTTATHVERAKGDRRRRIRLTPRAAILAVLVTALLLYLVVPLRAYMAQRERLQELEHQTEVLQEQNAGLLRQIDRLNDPAYIERLARECLQMSRPGEIPFVVVPASGHPAPPAC
jgi:cell division protein FtsB